MKKRKIFIGAATHKKVIKPFKNTYLHYCEVGSCFNKKHFCKIQDYLNDNISYKNKTYNELTLTYWIWKNINADIKGICHYRRFFVKPFGRSLLSRKDITNILSLNDAIVAKRNIFTMSSLDRIKTPSSALRIEDVPIVRNVIFNRYGNQCAIAFDKILNRNWNNLLNMLIAKEEIFDKYCEWLFPILEDLEKIINLDNYVGNEKRFFGLWGEYLFDVWLCNEKIRVFECNVSHVEFKNYLNVIKYRAKTILLYLYYSIIKKEKNKY